MTKKKAEDTTQNGEQKIRRVMLGTPSHDGKVTVQYALQMLETVRQCAAIGIQIIPIFVPGDALVQRARNDLFHIAYESGVDDLVMIDSDMHWSPEQFIRLLSHDVDLVGGTARKKTNEEIYVAKFKDPTVCKIEDNELIDVLGIGTGFIRFSAKAIKKLYDKAPKYKDDNGAKKAMVFNVTITKGIFTSEDISMCNMWRNMKQKVWLDPKITAAHIGSITFQGDFEKWLEMVYGTQEAPGKGSRKLKELN